MAIFTILLAIVFAICMISLHGKIHDMEKQLEKNRKELLLLKALIMKEDDTKTLLASDSIEYQSSAERVQPTLTPEQRARFEEFKRNKMQTAPVTSVSKVQKELDANVQKERSEGFENIFGKHILGFIAAILVFIGMLAFGSLIFNYLDDALKTIMVFVFSLAISAVGVFIHQKNQNAFTESVMGCGVGAVFISIFISHLFFNTFSDIIAFALVLIWAIGVFVLSKKVHSEPLLYIAHIGCLISLLMAVGSNSFDDRIFEIAIYQILTICLLLIMDIKLPNKLFKITTLVSMLMNNILAGCCYDELFFGETSVFAVIAITTLSTCVLHIIGHKREVGNKCIETVISIVLLIVNICTFLSSVNEIMLESNLLILNIVAVFILVGTLSGLILANDDERDNRVNIISFASFLSFMALIAAADATAMSDVVIPGVLFYALIMIALYHKNKNSSYLIAGVIMLFVDGFAVLFMLKELTLLLYVSILVFITFVISLIYEQKLFSLGILSFTMINTCWLISFVMFMDSLATDSQSSNLLLTITMIIISGINIIFRWLFKQHENKNNLYKATWITIDVVLHIIVIVNSCIIGIVLNDEYTALCYISLLALSIVTFVIGMLGIVTMMNKEDTYFGIWYAIKFTILTIIPLFQFTDLFDEQFIFSIILMFIASICILFGFKFKNKSIRIYGLIVILMSVIKIVIIDMWGQDSIIRVVALMLGGIICFAISALYNKFEKRYSLENTFGENQEQQEKMCEETMEVD